MHDAYALWEAGYEINKLIEQGQESGQFTVQSLLHLSHSFMEMGNLFVAEQYLVETEKYNQRLGSQDYAGRIGGYRGLLEHLRGNVRNAAEHYGKALRLLSRGGGNPRAESKFLQHRADLRILLKDLDGADEDIRVSIAIASEGDHPDLVAHARNSLGHLLRSRRKYSEARHEYQAAFDTARRKGIRRLEADVLSELSRLALDLGDSESAMNQAMKSMSIANELGLGIRQCHGLVVLGTASLMAEQREMGVAFLQTAWRRSRDSGYWLRAQEADKLLRSVGERPEENANESLPTN
jgi:tetratricopeptide (TPR) repeat protein